MREHVREQAGKHFDPDAVKTFLRHLAQEQREGRAYGK
jgi:HD-GYP domain-containing protein (c-di-GMP phosphodiesterase class II)